MSYQICRWYDPYPRLVFALKLLYLAPEELRKVATQELLQFFRQHLGYDALGSFQTRGKNRWYDSSTETAYAVELLKESPDPLKMLCANKLLESLAGAAS